MPISVEEEIRQLRSLFWSERDPEGRVFAPLADAYRRSGDLAQAVELLEEGLVRQMDFVPGHVVSGWVRRDRGEDTAAAIAFRAALALDAENAEAVRGLAELAAREAAASPRPQGGADVAPATPPATDDGPLTRTMADLYARQGLHDRALTVYRRLLERDPADDSLRARVQELEALLAGGGRGREVDVEKLARDWAEGPGDTGELSTPFAWAPALRSRPERPAGPAAREYFRGLLAWEPGAASAPLDAAEIAVPDVPETHAEPTPEGTVIPIVSLAPAEVVPVTTPAGPRPEAGAAVHVAQTLDPVPERVAAIAALAPDSVAIAALAPDSVAISALAPDAVPIGSLAPEAIPIGSLAPDRR